MSCDLTFRRCDSDDIEDILAFYTEMIDAMVGTDFDILWKHDVHPSHEFLRKNTACGNTIVGETESGRIATALVIDHDAAPGYEGVPWKVLAPVDEIGIVHSVATLPQYHGRGYARALMNNAIEFSRNADMKALRLDTFTTNVRAHGLYGSVGFIDHGAWPIYYDDLGTVELKMFEYVL